jgi:hypothetical protein
MSRGEVCCKHEVRSSVEVKVAKSLEKKWWWRKE